MNYSFLFPNRNLIKYITNFLTFKKKNENFPKLKQKNSE